MKLLIWLGALSSPSLFAHGISESDKTAMLAGGYLNYIWLGATHMLTGYDHLLFIFGVIFFLTTFKDIVKFISVFTLAHCITLIFATFFKITANYFLIDAVIALSVVYKGFENLDGFRRHFDWQAPSLLKIRKQYLLHWTMRPISFRKRQRPFCTRPLPFYSLNFDLLPASVVGESIG